MSVVRVRLAGASEPTIELDASYFQTTEEGDLAVYRTATVVGTFARGSWMYAVLLDDVPR